MLSSSFVILLSCLYFDSKLWTGLFEISLKAINAGKKKRKIGQKNPQTVFISLKLDSIYSNSSQQYYFETQVFLVFLCFLMLECRCSNLSKTFFYASFSGILSSRPLNPISNSSIFPCRTSAFIVSFFNSLENFFQLFNMIFFSDYILFTTLVSRIAFSLCFGDSKSSTLLTKTFHVVFVDCSFFLILL